MLIYNGLGVDEFSQDLSRCHSLRCIIAAMTFGTKVKQYRKMRGYSTQQALAAEMKVHVNTVGAWERDEAMPEGSTLAKLLEVLDATFEQLTAGDTRFTSSSKSEPARNGEDQPLSFDQFLATVKSVRFRSNLSAEERDRLAHEILRDLYDERYGRQSERSDDKGGD